MITLADLQDDEGFRDKPVARGVAGRSMSETPALEGARRAHIECEVNVDSLAYWNDPTGQKDQNFVSPFETQVRMIEPWLFVCRYCASFFSTVLVKGQEKFLTFSVDRGGWNNVRMSMEIIFVIAAATGRTLVLPPKEPLYRLHVSSVIVVLRGTITWRKLTAPSETLSGR